METVVAAIIEGPVGEVLMGRRNSGAWEFPSGSTKPGESSEAAMRRVAREKLGLTLDLHTGQPPLPGDYDGRRVAYRFFIARVSSGTAAPLGYAEVRWMTRDEILRGEFAGITQQVARWYTE